MTHRLDSVTRGHPFIETYEGEMEVVERKEELVDAYRAREYYESYWKGLYPIKKELDPSIKEKYEIVHALLSDERVIGEIDPGVALISLDRKKWISVAFKIPHLHWDKWLAQYRSGHYEVFKMQDHAEVEKWNRRARNGTILFGVYLIISVFGSIALIICHNSTLCTKK